MPDIVKRRKTKFCYYCRKKILDKDEFYRFDDRWTYAIYFFHKECVVPCAKREFLTDDDIDRLLEDLEGGI